MASSGANVTKNVAAPQASDFQVRRSTSEPRSGHVRGGHNQGRQRADHRVVIVRQCGEQQRPAEQSAIFPARRFLRQHTIERQEVELNGEGGHQAQMLPGSECAIRKGLKPKQAPPIIAAVSFPQIRKHSSRAENAASASCSAREALYATTGPSVSSNGSASSDASGSAVLHERSDALQVVNQAGVQRILQVRHGAREVPQEPGVLKIVAGVAHQPVRGRERRGQGEQDGQRDTRSEANRVPLERLRFRRGIFPLAKALPFCMHLCEFNRRHQAIEACSRARPGVRTPGVNVQSRNVRLTNRASSRIFYSIMQPRAHQHHPHHHHTISCPRRCG